MTSERNSLIIRRVRTFFPTCIHCGNTVQYFELLNCYLHHHNGVQYCERPQVAEVAP